MPRERLHSTESLIRIARYHTSTMLTDFLNFESLLVIILLFSSLGGAWSVVDVHVIHD